VPATHLPPLLAPVFQIRDFLVRIRIRIRNIGWHLQHLMTTFALVVSYFIHACHNNTIPLIFELAKKFLYLLKQKTISILRYFWLRQDNKMLFPSSFVALDRSGIREE
jgi:hypothetical protein